MSQSSTFISSQTAQRARITSSTDSIINQAVNLFFGWRDRSRSRRDLMRLTDHQLKDIGLSRHDAESEYQKSFWQQ